MSYFHESTGISKSMCGSCISANGRLLRSPDGLPRNDMNEKGRATHSCASAPTRSKSQLFEILFLAAPAVAAEQALPELVVVAPGFDRQRHGDAPAEQQHFFLGLEPGEHTAQSIPSRETGEHGMDIVLVAKPAGDARPKL